MSNKTRNRLANHRGRFTTITVQRANGNVSYSGKVKRLTEKSVVFADQNSGGRLLTVPLARIVG